MWHTSAHFVGRGSYDQRVGINTAENLAGTAANRKCEKGQDTQEECGTAGGGTTVACRIGPKVSRGAAQGPPQETVCEYGKW